MDVQGKGINIGLVETWKEIGMPVVRWEYYTPNEDREEAAREALAEMRNPDSTCNLFTVREDVGTDEYTRVDLAEATRSG